MTMRLGIIQITVFMVMVNPMTMRVFVLDWLVDMLQFISDVRRRPQSRCQHRKDQDSAGQNQRCRFNTNTGPELPGYRIKNQPAKM